MVDKTNDTERWNEVLRIALAKEMRTFKLHLYSKLTGINLPLFVLEARLFFGRRICKLFLYGKFCYHKGMVLLMESFLFLNDLYDKLPTHKRAPLVGATEILNM